MTRLVSIGRPGQGERTYPPRIFFHVEKPPRPGSRRRAPLALTPINSLGRASDCADTMHHVRVTEALCTPSCLPKLGGGQAAMARKGVKGGQADATVAGIRSGSRPMRGPDENNTGVGSRANHAAHAFSGVVDEGPPPGVQWSGFVDFSGTTNGSEPGGGDDADRPQGVQVVLRRVESSHRMTSLDELGSCRIVSFRH